MVPAQKAAWTKTKTKHQDQKNPTQLKNQPDIWRESFLGRRLATALDFVNRRKSAQDLDDQLRQLADNDAMGLEGSYALTRFITWAIPILGFLGTVLGITGAIAGVTPEVLEESLSTVTDGLALAFDSTALALALTMVLMFVASNLERSIPTTGTTMNVELVVVWPDLVLASAPMVNRTALPVANFKFAGFIPLP
jgi:biopolymer transport protein ExbB/TolQ